MRWMRSVQMITTFLPPSERLTTVVLSSPLPMQLAERTSGMFLTISFDQSPLAHLPSLSDHSQVIGLPSLRRTILTRLRVTRSPGAGGRSAPGGGGGGGGRSAPSGGAGGAGGADCGAVRVTARLESSLAMSIPVAFSTPARTVAAAAVPPAVPASAIRARERGPVVSILNRPFRSWMVWRWQAADTAPPCAALTIAQA